MENFLAGQLAGKLTGAAAAASEQKNGRDDKAIPAQAVAEVLRSIVKVWYGNVIAPPAAKLSETRKSLLRHPEILNTSTAQQTEKQWDTTLKQL